jgi:hypothetical protein
MFVVRARFGGPDDNHWSIPSRVHPVSGWGVVEAILTHECVSSFEEQTVDALATGAEEGRSNLR